MKIKAIVGTFIRGKLTCIKSIRDYNRAIKVNNQKAYDKSIEKEISLVVEMYSNPLFAQLLDSTFWSDIRSGRNKHKRRNSVLTDTEREIADFYLFWKENE